MEEDLDHHGVTIDLGYRVTSSDGKTVCEPIARVWRDGTSVVNALVFVSLGSNSRSTANEVATVLDSTAEPAYYRSETLQIEDANRSTVVTYRVVVPAVAESLVRVVNWSKSAPP